MISFLNLFESEAFANSFWLFLGILSGALIQHTLSILSSRRQARTALRVMQIELEYNLGEVSDFLSRVKWLKERISSGQIKEYDLFIDMQKFDYSSIAPLANSGYFHILLGPRLIKRYLEFSHFFRVGNAENLTKMLKIEHGSGRSMAFLDWVEERAAELSNGVEPITRSRLGVRGLKEFKKLQ
ncbi:hypothetical protein [Pseudooceanicola sp.]|uniref:hypothetical protein n=1 Tax=Pseudooceanicola sp. TaxID=1914328 RepID=UPI0035138750